MRKGKPLGPEEFELIDPSEMSKLRVIAYLASRGSGEYARDVADAITSEPAIEVANVLIDKKKPQNQQVADIARGLKGSLGI
jgi:hypothetical protein